MRRRGTPSGHRAVSYTHLDVYKRQVPSAPVAGGLYLLGVAGSYLAFCLAHNRYVNRQKPELPPCGRQNGAALLALALLAAAGVSLLAAGVF